MYDRNNPLQEENEEAPLTKNNEIKMKQVLPMIYNKHALQTEFRITPHPNFVLQYLGG